MLDWKDMCNLQQAEAVVVPREAFVPQRELYQRPMCPIITCAVVEWQIWIGAFQISMQSLKKKRKQVLYPPEYCMPFFFHYKVNLFIDQNKIKMKNP